MYIIENTNNRDKKVLNSKLEVFNYLNKHHNIFADFSIYTDWETVKVLEASAEPNGLIFDDTIEAFFEGFVDDGIIIEEIE